MLPLEYGANFGFVVQLKPDSMDMKNEALIVDLYELTMAAGYFEQNYNPKVTFELFIRELPESRNFLVAAGLEQVIQYLQNLHFSEEQISYLKTVPNFKNISQDFFDYLKEFRFNGNLYAVPEGTIVFAGEPLVQIEASLIEAQIVETFLLSSINFQTMVASKAVRVMHAANLDKVQRGVMEFGSRRAHGPEASVFAARAAYLAGFMGTSNVEAGFRFGIPVLGTTAHSWTMAFKNESEAFERYQEIFGKDATFLIDTYDTVQGAKNAMAVSDDFKAVRIDSGDLEQEAKKIRNLFDENGYPRVKIILSSDLNEYKIEKLVRNGTPVDFFGVGTQVAVSFDAPTLQGVYKMVEIEEQGAKQFRAKFSSRKVTLPARKQIWRFKDARDTIAYDLLSMVSEDYSKEAKPLLKAYILAGLLVKKNKPVGEVRERLHHNLAELPAAMLKLTQKTEYPIKISAKLQALASRLKQDVLEV